MKRFWARVTRGKPDECWPWNGQRVNGYGRFSIGRKNHLAHRFSYQLANGPIPDDVRVLHRCDNRPCCNDAHLFPGTVADNNADMRAKGRGHCLPPAFGETNPNAKLTDAQVQEIRLSNETGADLARRFTVPRSTISKIRHRKQWAHLPEPTAHA